jgi:hypothetical protein
MRGMGLSRKRNHAGSDAVSTLCEPLRPWRLCGVFIQSNITAETQSTLSYAERELNCITTESRTQMIKPRPFSSRSSSSMSRGLLR